MGAGPGRAPPPESKPHSFGWPNRKGFHVKLDPLAPLGAVPRGDPALLGQAAHAFDATVAPLAVQLLGAAALAGCAAWDHPCAAQAGASWHAGVEACRHWGWGRS